MALSHEQKWKSTQLCIICIYEPVESVAEQMYKDLCFLSFFNDLLFYMYWCFASMYVWERLSDPLELELQPVVR